MAIPHTLPAHRLARAVHHLVEGSHEWGLVQSWSEGPTGTGFRLVVFPPDIATAERILLRFWRLLPASGAALALVALLVGHGLGAVGLTLLALLAGYAATATVLARATSGIRSRLRTVAGIRFAGDLLRPADPDLLRLETLLDQLTRAEIAWRGGRSPAAVFSRVWTEAYDRMEPDSPVA